MDVGGILGGVGSIIGAVGGIWGTKKTNKTNRKLAAKQMEFEERMSNTALQRGMKDAKAAGINPMYVFGNGYSASTPTGTTAQQVNEGESWLGISEAMTAYQKLLNSRKEGKLLDTQNEKTKAETEEIKQQIEAIKQQINNNKPKEEINKSITSIIEEIKNKYNEWWNNRENTASKEMSENEIFRKKTIKYLENNGVKLSSEQQKRLFDLGNRAEIERVARKLAIAEWNKMNRKDYEKYKKILKNI